MFLATGVEVEIDFTAAFFAIDILVELHFGESITEYYDKELELDVKCSPDLYEFLDDNWKIHEVPGTDLITSDSYLFALVALNARDKLSNGETVKVKLTPQPKSPELIQLLEEQDREREDIIQNYKYCDCWIKYEII